MNDHPGFVDTAYLDMLKSVVQREKWHSYEFLRLQPGNSVLEVGCGPASDTLALADLVGPNGEVVGVDFDPEMIVEANERAKAAGLEARVIHQAADATALPFADGSFDASRSERLFQHLPNPAAALAEMIRVTRPGGRIVVFDTDHGSVLIDSTEPEIGERLRRFMFDSKANTPAAGRQLYRLFREAGLLDVMVEPRTIPSVDLAFARVAGNLTELAQQAIEAKVVSADEVRRWEGSLEQAAAAGTFFGCWTMMLAAGTRG